MGGRNGAPVAGARGAAMRTATILAAMAAGLLTMATASCTPRTSMDTSAVQVITDMSDAIVDIRSQMADLQGQIDSLRAVTARQDTLVRRLAVAQGIPVPQP